MVLDYILVDIVLYLTVEQVKMLLFLELDMSSSVHIYYKGEDMLIIGKGPTKGLNHTLTA